MNEELTSLGPTKRETQDWRGNKEYQNHSFRDIAARELVPWTGDEDDDGQCIFCNGRRRCYVLQVM